MSSVDDEERARLIREAPLDDRPMTEAEREAIARARSGNVRWVPSAEVRAKVEARLRDGK